MLLLLTLGNYEARRLRGLQWYNIHTAVREGRPPNSVVDWRRTEHDDLISILSFLESVW
jgi:hypothetical protein